MKLILSRKGFDSSAGGGPSPILPDGRLLSLPIPDSSAPVAYRQLLHQDINLGKMVSDLSKGKIKPSTKAHLDPDLDCSLIPRGEGWRPVFGQMGAAEGHLRTHGISPGDLFLFFGWFREVERYQRKWRYKKNAPDQHVIFGWMQVGQRLVLDGTSDEVPAWMAQHPHLFGQRGPNNTVYIAQDRLSFPGVQADIGGGGVFDRVKPRQVLTRKGETRCHWQLPAWFAPYQRESVLSYHHRLSRWQIVDNLVHLHSVARGQEFVLDVDHYPEAFSWLAAFWDESSSLPVSSKLSS